MVEGRERDRDEEERVSRVLRCEQITRLATARRLGRWKRRGMWVYFEEVSASDDGCGFDGLEVAAAVVPRRWSPSVGFSTGC